MKLQDEVAGLEKQLAAAQAENERLREALQGIMPFTIDGTVECRGDKCRKRWCLSCNTEADAQEAVADAYNAFAVVNEALATSQSDCLREHDAKLVERIAENWEYGACPANETLMSIADKIRKGEF